MDVARFFFRLFLVDEADSPVAFLGSAFPVTPGGSLLTCRHVVDIEVPQGHALAVLDPISGFIRLEQPPVFSSDPAVDMALLRGALGAGAAFFPILPADKVLIGEDVFTFGFFSIGGTLATVEQGYFGGRVVNVLGADAEQAHTSFTLPFPVLEGMSGSPILTYHNGPKLVGIATGNRSSRILASEIMEYNDGVRELKETVNRIVEFGVAAHALAVTHFLLAHGVTDLVVSENNVNEAGFTASPG